MTVLDGDPPSASEWSAGDRSEALLACCALAFAWRAHLVVRDRAHADNLVTHERRDRTPEEVLRWREYTPVPTWQTRWAWAVRVVRRCRPDLAGATELPTSHWEAPLPVGPTTPVDMPLPG